jgi:hypothetical protein
MHYTNNDLQNFANESINVKSKDLKEFREQSNRLRDNLTDYINKNPEYGLIKMLNSGSIAKGTALRTINDMDIAVYVKANVVEGTDETGILEYVRSALITVYKRYNMSEDQFSIGSHCIKVSFRGTGLDVDVVPVIYDDGAEDRGYLINKDSGERVLTSIPLHIKFIRKRKDAYSNYAQMVRIIKWWRNQRQFKMKSFLIELIWAHIADTEGISSDINTALKQFFTFIIRTRLESPIIFEDYYKKKDVSVGNNGSFIFDPVNPQNNVGSSLDNNKRELIIDETEEALGYLSHAIQSSTKGVVTSSLKQIFGSSFAY